MRINMIKKKIDCLKCAGHGYFDSTKEPWISIPCPDCGSINQDDIKELYSAGNFFIVKKTVWKRIKRLFQMSTTSILKGRPCKNQLEVELDKFKKNIRRGKQ